MASSPAGDGGRPLSALGRAQIEALSARLSAEGWQPSLVFASALLRARQTAQIVLEGRAERPDIQTLEALDPEADPEELEQVLASAGPRPILLVGHMPCVGRLVQAWTGEVVAFSPGTMVRMAIAGFPARSHGRILEIFHPD